MSELAVPDGRDAVIATFGDITKYIRADGTLSPQWEADKIRRVVLPRPLQLSGSSVTVTRITCHKLLVDILRAALQTINDAGKWPALRSYGGGFVFRLKRTVTELSLHAWGIAWDFDPEDNQQGTTGALDTDVVAFFLLMVFSGVGTSTAPKTPMHFQYAIGT